MSINRNAFAGQLLDERYRLFVELSVDQPTSGLFIGQDSHTQENVYVRLLSGPEQYFSEFAGVLSACRAIRDPRLVSVADFGHTTTLAYYVMPMQAGLSQCRLLADVLRQEGPFDARRVINLASQIAAGLEHAASGGVVHGNLNPKTILLMRDEALGEQASIWDFGTASALPGLYAARYSAPERLAGQPPDIRSDIYSFGVVLYEMLSGRLPILAVSDELESWKLSHTRGLPRPLKSINAQLPDFLADLVMQCLQKDPIKRPQSMLSLMQALCVADRRPTSRSGPRRPTLLVAGLAGALLAGGGGWAVLQWFGRPAPPTAQPAAEVRPSPDERLLATAEATAARKTADGYTAALKQLERIAADSPIAERARARRSQWDAALARLRSPAAPMKSAAAVEARSTERRDAPVDRPPRPLTVAAERRRPVAPAPLKGAPAPLSAAPGLRASPRPLGSPEAGDPAALLKGAPAPLQP